jgi:hypothetical protein
MPRHGSKRTPKTGRKRGAMVRHVREIGKDYFTRRDLPFTPYQSWMILHYMVKRGEAIRVFKGTRGRYAAPAIYKLKQMKLI